MFYMRHGQSTFNANESLGRDPQIPDAPLTELGQQQVERAAQKLLAAQKPIAQIVSSPYTRAIQSAQIVASVLKVDHIICPMVRERALYSCDIGQDVGALQKQWPHLDFSAVQAGQWWAPVPETHNSLAQRIQNFKEKWQFDALAARTLIVSHYYYINGVTGAAPNNAEVIFYPL